MKTLFVNIAYPKERYIEFKEDARGILQVPCDVFQWAVIDGLEACGSDYTLASVPALPAWPRYKHLFTPSGIFYVNGLAKGHYLSYCNAPAIKQISQKHVLRKYIRQWCETNRNEDRLAVITYTQQVELLGAAISLKKDFPNLVVVPIITDLIENAFDFKSNKSFLKRLQVEIEARGEHTLFPQVDKFVLLTQQMTDYIPEAKDKYIVIEGISPKGNESSPKVLKKKSPRTLLYTGALEEYAGVRLLVDAFMETKCDDFRLIICGSGTDSSYVRDASIKDYRIDFRGKVEHAEVIKLQRESTMLINPRQPNGNITKYSFPSKTMEYMCSGTPMIGYYLEGIPEEYYQYMYSPENLSKAALTICINKVLSLTNNELIRQAEMAHQFIAEEKNNRKQVNKILKFLKD